MNIGHRIGFALICTVLACASMRAQDRVNRRIRMIKEDCTNGAIVLEIVFVGRIVAVPRNHIQRRMTDLGFMKLAAPFDGHG